ncbi:unnamed protein product [Amaranthus hypochondriacus]
MLNSRFLLIFLLFSYFSSILAVPSSRSFVINQNEVRMEKEVNNWGKEGGKVKARMDLELTDYAGTGANPNHDPTKPGNNG